APALVVVDDTGAVMYARGTVDVGAVESDAERFGPAEAADRAADALGLGTAGITAVGERAAGSGRSGATRLVGPGLGAASSVRRVFVRTASGTLRLAYEVSLYPSDPAAWAVVRIDVATGDVLSLHRMAAAETGVGEAPGTTSAVPVATPPETAPALVSTDGASYLAFPGRSPLDGDRALLREPALPLASPYGWHDTDARPGPEFTTTRGNNVHAFPDRIADGVPDAAGVPDGGATLVFAPPLDLSSEPSSYTEASVVNAFVWANHAHDVLYSYGFDEAGGNFQANAYGRAGGDPRPDPVSVRVQSGGGTDNADMAVPADGMAPILTIYEETQTTPRRDYALDTEVVLHEYAHGLTSRLTGGPADAACLGIGAEGQGLSEGWSDWYALMLTMRAGDSRLDARSYSAYATGQGAGGPGSRLSPYSTDFAINGTTYASTAGMTGRHAVGLVWATVLWEISWDLIGAHGFDPDLTNARGPAGNQIAISLVTEALRLQPCGPGFVDARNAILYADLLLYNGAHVRLLQTAFARRGLGRGARQGSTGTNADNVASFEVETGLVDIMPPA
ncbi:MAG TPA: M36 family metallopeptidase, partial [Rubricoccaceae bacterium]